MLFLTFLATMEKKIYKCISTGVEITNDRGSVIFDCPKCGEQKIIRSFKARQTSVKYKCPSCDFEGPN